jgi:hypothetical protein
MLQVYQGVFVKGTTACEAGGGMHVGYAAAGQSQPGTKHTRCHPSLTRE